MASEITLTMEDLREVVAFSIACAADVLELFERPCPDDSRPRRAIEAALVFARGGDRNLRLRQSALAALKAAGECQHASAKQAARAAMCAPAAAFLHPLARATQVRHILGSAAYAARAVELEEGDATDTHLVRPSGYATPRLIDILSRYPDAPLGGGRVGELLREIDLRLRATRPGPR